MLQHIERVLAVLRGGGCSVDLSHHALHLLGSRILGFSQDLFDDSPDAADPAAATPADAWPESMPHVAELAAAVAHGGTLGACDDDRDSPSPWTCCWTDSNGTGSPKQFLRAAWSAGVITSAMAANSSGFSGRRAGRHAGVRGASPVPRGGIPG